MASHNPPSHNPFVHNGASDAPSFLAIPAGFTIMGARLNNVTSTTIGSGVATRLGFSALNRQSSTTVEAFRNGASIGTAALASTASVSQAIYIGAFNNNGTTYGFSTDRVAFASLGAGLTSTEQANFYSRVNTLLTGFGAN